MSQQQIEKAILTGTAIDSDPNNLRKYLRDMLRVLARAKAPLTRAMICDRSGVDASWVGLGLGKTDEKARLQREAGVGRPGLITLGYVTVSELDLYGDGSVLETTYRITELGSAAAKLLRSE